MLSVVANVVTVIIFYSVPSSILASAATSGVVRNEGRDTPMWNYDRKQWRGGIRLMIGLRLEQ